MLKNIYSVTVRSGRMHVACAKIGRFDSCSHDNMTLGILDRSYNRCRYLLGCCGKNAFSKQYWGQRQESYL